MSRASDAMQFVLDIMAGIIDGTSTGTTTTSLGQQFVDVTPDQLPFVQVFQPTLAAPTAELLQPVGDLTFNLTITDFLVGTLIDPPNATPVADLDMQAAVDSLAATINRDASLGGIVQHALVTASQVFDLDGATWQTAALVITCELAQDFRTEFIELADFSDVTKFTTITAAIEQSTRVPNAVGLNRDAVISARLVWDSATDLPSFGPLDLSVTKYVRLLLYQDEDASNGAVNIEMHVGARNGPSPLVDYRRYLETRSWHGPKELVFDLSLPFATVGSPPALSATTSIHFLSVNFGAPATTDFGMIFMEFGRIPRDVGLNDGRGTNPPL